MAEELEEYRRRFREWLASTEIPAVPDDPDEKFRVLRAWQRRLYEAGWLGVDWPREHGGKGLTPLHQAAVLEELAWAGAPLPVSRTNLDAVGPTLVAFGTDDQKQRWLPKLCSAEDLWCQGFSEPNAGSDLASLRTTAIREGDEFVVNGQKIWTSQAHRADRILLLARTDPSAPRYKDLSLFGVDIRSPGITVRPLKQITGRSEFNEVFFDQVRVPAADLIGPLHEGWRVAMHTLGGERGRILLLRRADAEAAFRTLIKALKSHLTRTKTPLSADVVRRIGQVRMKLAALEGQVRATAKRMERDERPGPLDSLDRLVLVEIEQELSGLAFDLLGPYRMAGDAQPLSLDPAQTLYRYLYGRSYSLSGGTTQVQLNVVAERLLGLPRT